MSVIDPKTTNSVELSRAEQWVVHHVLLDALGLADGDPDGTVDDHESQRSLAVIEKLESGSFEFTPAELTLLRRACGAHARNTEATADRNLATAVANRVDVILRDVPV